MKYWNIFLEKFSVPFIHGIYPLGTGKEGIDALKEAVDSISMDSRGVSSEGTTIDFKQVSATGEPIFKIFADFCDTQVSRACLGQAQTGNTGGFTSADTARKNAVRHDLIESDAKKLDRLNLEQLIKPTVLFNFGPDAVMPVYVSNYEEGEDLKMLAEVYQICIGFGQPVSQEHVSERFSIPLPKDNETLLQAQNPKPVVPQQTDMQALKDIVPRGTITGNQAEIDALAADATQKTDPVMAAMMKRIIDIMAGESDYNKALDKVMQEFPYEQLGRITEMMTRALFVGQNIGRAGNA